MSAAELLSRLEGVRDRGRGQWLACCPAHADRSPSLSIKETDDGRVLLHDFGGCSVEEILCVLNMTFSDLYPDTLEPRKGTRQRWNPRDLLLVLKHECLICACATGRLLDGGELSREDVERMQVAVNRINSALEVAGVR